MSQYVRDRWGMEQGFPRGAVYAITQTSDGYLWVGTETGLWRFDGFEFRLIPGRSQSARFTAVVSLAADKDGSLWVGLRDLSILRYRHGAFEEPFANPAAASDITAIATTRHGELLAARLQNGAFTYGDGKLKLLAPAAGLPRSPVLSVAQTDDGSFWLGTRGAGLYRLRGGTTLPITAGLPDPKVNCLLPGGNGDLWIGTDNGIVRWNGSELDNHDIPAALKNAQILSLTKDRDSNLWVGTDSGDVLRVNADGVASLEQNPNDLGNAVTALFDDREGNLWIGSANGIERLRDSPFVTYSSPEGLPTDGSNPVYVDAENRMWFPPAAGGLWWLKDGRHGFIQEDGIERDIIYSLAGGKDELWLGRQHGGLTVLRSEHGSFRAKTFTGTDGLAQNSVFSVYLDRAGVVWAGTLSGGVSKLDRGRFTTYTMADGLASNTVATMLEGGNGTMWFGTPSGLSSLAKGRWRTFRSSDGLPSENINCLLEDSKGVLWAGTTAGLAFLRSGRFEAPIQVTPPLHEQILGTAEDKYGSIWITTSNHVLRVDGAKLLHGGLAEGGVFEFGLADGLRGVEGVKRQRSVITDSTGRIWMSLNRGISVVDPARLTRSSAPAMPHIQGISADGSAIGKRPIRVPAGSQRIVSGYAGLSLSVPDRVRFRYKLDGFDRGWSEPLSERHAAYTNLGPGSYRFRLVASNPDGVWNGKEADLAFEVDPKYWQSWWFRAALALSVALGVLAFYRLRSNSPPGSTTGLRNGWRNEPSSHRDLHDTLLQGFISASMQIHVATDLLPGESKAKASLTRALDLMRQVIEEGRNTVRGLRSTRSTSMDLEEAFARIQDELTPGVGASGETPEPVDFRVITEGQRMPLHPVLRDEVYRIGREALVNAFRHARAKKIEIELNYSPTLLRVLIRDNGCGIDPQTLDGGRDGHWGLSGMRERADRIGARLRLWSSNNGGTEVELTVPGHIAFQVQDGAATRRNGGEQPSVRGRAK